MILVDNEFVERNHLAVDMEDRAYQFGDGIYEVIRVYGGRLFAMDGHLDRLWRSAGGIRLPLPFKREELAAKLSGLVSINNLSNGYIYLQVSRGVAPRAHHFPAEVKPLLVGYTVTLERPLDLMNNGVKAITTEDVRWLRCDIKSLNLLGNVLAKQEALEKGAAEAIMHRGGVVTEGSSSNIFMVKDRGIYTHPLSNLILGGITRDVIISLAKELDIRVHEQPFTVNDLSTADEVFASSTTIEVLPIVCIDGQDVGSGSPGEVTRLLQAAFEKLIS